jgi:hypothetical protein
MLHASVHWFCFELAGSIPACSTGLHEAVSYWMQNNSDQVALCLTEKSPRAHKGIFSGCCASTFYGKLLWASGLRVGSVRCCWHRTLLYLSSHISLKGK